MELRDQIAIYKQDRRVLGKRPKAETEHGTWVEQARYIDQLQTAVTNEIKRRRKPTIPADRPITLDERRALDRANITKILKEY